MLALLRNPAGRPDDEVMTGRHTISLSSLFPDEREEMAEPMMAMDIEIDVNVSTDKAALWLGNNLSRDNRR
jgi:hypothetical protein